MLYDQREYQFHVYPDAVGEWRWHLKAGNGRIVADSGEGYTRQQDCIRSLANFKNRVATAKIVRHPTPREKVAEALLRRG